MSYRIWLLTIAARTIWAYIVFPPYLVLARIERTAAVLGDFLYRASGVEQLEDDTSELRAKVRSR